MANQEQEREAFKSQLRAILHMPMKHLRRLIFAVLALV
jgi:hypothetical protein